MGGNIVYWEWRALENSHHLKVGSCYSTLSTHRQLLLHLVFYEISEVLSGELIQNSKTSMGQTIPISGHQFSLSNKISPPKKISGGRGTERSSNLPKVTQPVNIAKDDMVSWISFPAQKPFVTFHWATPRQLLLLFIVPWACIFSPSELSDGHFPRLVLPSTDRVSLPALITLHMRTAGLIRTCPVTDEHRVTAHLCPEGRA